MDAERPSPTFRTCVIIPAYNAQGTIGELVWRLKALRLDIIVVSDGSTDRTTPEATGAGAVVINHLHNCGKGAAIRTGFAHAVEAGYDAVITMDSDGQHDPADVPKLLHAAHQTPSAVVIGQRMRDDGVMPPLRWWTNRLMSGMVSLMTGRTVPDSQCGFRVLPRPLLLSVRLSSCRFEIETELLLAAIRQGWEVVSVPIRTIYDHQASHIRPLADGARFLRVVLRYLLLPPIAQSQHRCADLCQRATP